MNTVTLAGKEVPLSFTMKEFLVLENVHGINAFSLPPLSPRLLLCLLWAGVMRAMPEASVESLAELVDTRNSRDLNKAVFSAFAEAMPPNEEEETAKENDSS